MIKSSAVEIKDIKDISENLSAENKKYVIAVANALLFSQKQAIQPHKLQMQNADKQFNPAKPEEMTLYQLSLNFEDASTDPRQHRSEE